MSAVSPRTPIYKDFVLIQLAILIFVIDQFSKFLVRDLLLFRESFPATGFFRFTHTHNTGSAFGIFQDQNTPLIIVSVIGIGILIMIYRSQRVPTEGDVPEEAVGIVVKAVPAGGLVLVAVENARR